MAQLRSLRLISAGMIRSLEPLRRLPRLRDLRLNEVGIIDGDLTPLFGLSSWTEIVPPSRFIDDPKRYSHAIEQLRELGWRR